jgi:16S rRNA (guanine527-N7)-methyltransferase
MSFCIDSVAELEYSTIRYNVFFFLTLNATLPTSMPRTIPDNACSPEKVRIICESLRFAPDAETLSALCGYLSLLGKWNRVMNLTGATGWEDMLRTLVLDSFYLAPFVCALPLPAHPRCWDLGAGAGLPGIPLRMLWKHGDYTLVEAREKRALFLRTVLASCPLQGVHIFQGRVERFMAGQAPAHLVISRAFMPWEKLLALIAPYLTRGAFCVFLALSPLPSSLPEGWTAAAQTQYTVAGHIRYFWALEKA